MPRTARLDAPGILHHIIIRGIERKQIFRNKHDRDNLLHRLSKLLPETGTTCYAWAFMSNHAHFLLRTGQIALSRVMMRLLTGYAVYFNHRYKRNGPLFQNRYKSIICQEDIYLKELVRYIHLNPLRAGIVRNISQLNNYAYSGHSVLIDRKQCQWQDSRYILSFFGNRVGKARSNYLEYVEQARDQGRRKELTGGGLIRSLGGWEEVKKVRFKGRERIKSDERILGESDFVDQVLRIADESLSRQYELKRLGYDLKKVEEKVARKYKVDTKYIYVKGRKKDRVECRSLYCYWAAHELKVPLTELAKKFDLSVPAVYYAVQRGEKIAEENNYQLID